MYSEPIISTADSDSLPAVVVVGAVVFVVVGVVVAVDSGVVVVVPEQDLDECVHVNLVSLFYWLLVFGDYGKIWNMMSGYMNVL